MKDRIIRLFSLILFAAVFCALSESAPLFAQTYNALHQLLGNRPQFNVEPVRNGDAIQVPNAGIGDGISTTSSSQINGVSLSNSTLFCNSDDEENAFLGNTAPGVFGNSLDSLGSYHFSKLRDLWREARDGEALYFGEPLVATNCTRFGQKGVLSFNQWRDFSTPTVNGNTTFLRNQIRTSFRDRNFMEDDSNFRYGRYLFKFMPASGEFDSNAFGLAASPSIEPAGNAVYQFNFYEPDHLDCPYGREHQRFGFLCGQMASAQAYVDLHLPPADVSPILLSGDIHPQQWNFYRELFRQVVEMIGVRIDREYWGRLRPRFSFGGGSGSQWEGNERQMAGIVVTIWEIAKQAYERMPEAPFGGVGQAIQAILGEAPNITATCGNTPDDVLVALNGPQLVFRKDLCVDPQARRTLSNPHFNVYLDPNQPGINVTAPSYGSLIDRGLYDNLFVPNRGYRWVVNTSTHVMSAEAKDGKVASYGYGGPIVAFMFHQLCHEFYRRQEIEFVWGTPQAVAEEDLCMMGQSLFYETLNSLAHIRGGGPLTSEEYNPDPDPNRVNVEDGFIGKRFFYRDEIRGKNNIVVAPLHEDMMGIAQNLQRRDHEMARMQAHLTASCPFFAEPQYMSRNGRVENNPYDVEPVPAPPPAEEPHPIIDTAGPSEGDVQGQMQQGIDALQFNQQQQQGGGSGQQGSQPELNLNGQGGRGSAQLKPQQQSGAPKGGTEQPKSAPKTAPSPTIPGAPGGTTGTNKNQGTGTRK